MEEEETLVVDEVVVEEETLVVEEEVVVEEDPLELDNRCSRSRRPRGSPKSRT